MVGSIEAAALEDYRNRVNDAVRSCLAFGAHSYRFLIKPLFPFKMVLTHAALIVIDRHYLPHTIYPS